ncbi:hypothetical protein [Xanthobacter sp. KR7-225]|uniref:hypothetical protein n=1 Tax=Xanthobacter sp. KR7-225 TaxID=3156613 RepID=UPI0032B373EA
MIAPDALAASVALARRIAAAPAESSLSPPRSVETNAKPVLHTRAASLAVAVSVDQTIAMARALAALDQVAQLAAEFRVAQDAALDWTTRRISPADLPQLDAADTAVETGRTRLDEALIACGYATLEDQEKTDGNAG